MLKPSYNVYLMHTHVRCKRKYKIWRYSGMFGH